MTGDLEVIAREAGIQVWTRDNTIVFADPGRLRRLSKVGSTWKCMQLERSAVSNGTDAPIFTIELDGYAICIRGRCVFTS